jgi:hypothetical protein
MSGLALATVFTQPTATTTVAPRSLAMTVVLDEGQVVTGWNDTCNCAVQLDTPSADSEVIAGEYVRWAPSTLVMNAGDTLALTIKNPRGGDHGFAILAPADAFSGTTAAAVVQGRTNSGNPDERHDHVYGAQAGDVYVHLPAALRRRLAQLPPGPRDDHGHVGRALSAWGAVQPTPLPSSRAARTAARPPFPLPRIDRGLRVLRDSEVDSYREGRRPTGEGKADAAGTSGDGGASRRAHGTRALKSRRGGVAQGPANPSASVPQ